MQDQYQTIFELGFRSFPWPSIIRLLVFIAVGLLLIQLFKRRTVYVLVGVFVASIATIILLVSLVVFVPDFFKLRNAYASGKDLGVEGTVQDFRPAPAIGPLRESFSVGGVLFSH